MSNTAEISAGSGPGQLGTALPANLLPVLPHDISVHISFLPCHLDRCLGIFRRSYLTTCLKAPFTGAEAAREASPHPSEASMQLQSHERQGGMP